MTLNLDVQDRSPDGPEANRPLSPDLRISRSPDERDGSRSRCHPAIHDDLVRTLGKVGKDAVAYSMVTKYARMLICSYARMLAALSFQAERKEATPPLPELQTKMWNAVLPMRQYSRLLPNFRFRFRLRLRLCASFRG
jgi:hypothetical protein